MAAFAALKVLSAAQRHFLSRNDDDLTDRLHYIVAPAVLLSLATFHGLKQYFGRPVECWPTSEMARDQWLNYVHGFCFVEDTYFVGFNEHFPVRRVDRDHRQLHYYQWVPFLLMAQALLLILPKAFWFLFVQKNGFSVSYLMHKLGQIGRENANSICPRGFTTAAEGFALQMAKDRRDQLFFRRGVQLETEAPTATEGSTQSLRLNPLSLFIWWLNDQKLTFGYIAYKLANLAIVLLQFHFLNSYFVSDEEGGHFPWGLKVFVDLLGGRDWRESGHFPRVTFCDLLIRPSQRDMKPMRYTFQCLLNMNMINEKMFLFILFALFLLALLDCLNLALWLYRCFSWRSAEQFVRDELRKLQKDAAISVERNDNLRTFVKYSLGRDTVTLLHIVNANCRPLTSAKMIGQLWHYHKKGFIGFKSVRQKIPSQTPNQIHLI